MSDYLGNDGFEISLDTRAMDKALATLDAKLQSQVVTKALQAGGDVLLEAVQLECPERTDEPTPGSDSLPPGILRYAQITQVQISEGHTPRIKVGTSDETKAYAVARWINDGYDLVKGGRRRKSRRKGAKPGDMEGNGHLIRHIDPNPFYERAFDTVAEVAVDTMLETLGNSLFGAEDTSLEGVGADKDFDYGDD